MSGLTDYTWDTSDEEGGMEIDLNPKAEEPAPTVLAQAPEVSEKEDYDPSEPTDDYDPSEPTKDGEDPQEGGPSSPPVVADYDPAEPTLSDEDINSPTQDTASEGEKGQEEEMRGEVEEQDRVVSPTDEEKEEGSRQEEKEEGANRQEEEEGSRQEEEEVDNADGRWDSQAILSDEEAGNEVDNSEQGGENIESLDESQDKVQEAESKGSTPSASPKPQEVFKAPFDTDDNTQTSVAENEEDNMSDLPDVTIDDSDFVLEKEPFDQVKRDAADGTTEPSQEDSLDRRDAHPSENEEEETERERTRRQEEIDSRNEEALVDLFREESDPDKMEEEAEQPQKKTKKKVGSKKLKKKGKKVKKGQGKKGSSKPEDGDQRFVEIRRERQSLESWEEGELEGEAENLRRKLQEERIQLDLYDKAFESQGGIPDSDEQREPGEIVEMDGGKKRGVKKKDKKEKKKKKSRREVATIEEGGQEDDSQKFPSFLAGFFVQDEDIDENVDLDGEPFTAEEGRHSHRDKNYRKRHDSGAEDSVKSFDPNVPTAVETHETRTEEVDHRRVRRHEERRHDSRERRHESRDTREVRREREHRHNTPRERERDRGRAERERAREKERHREREKEFSRERSRRSEAEERMERRRHRSRSHERRRKSRSHERRSRSRDRSSRHRRHRSRSRDRSGERENRERERERERERSKRRHRDRSREREPERWVRRASGSRSRSPHRRSERASSNKENREESSRRRHHVQQEDSESEEQGSPRSSQRRQHHHQRRRERAASSSSSSSSSASQDSRNREHRHHHHHHHHVIDHHSSDEGASSDVILVEPERIVINLDDEEDPPSRVDITHANAVDDSTTMVDGESIPPPPELSSNSRSSALIEINPAPAENEEEQDGDATPTRDELSDTVSGQSAEKRPAPVESDYDPAHPTEEGEDKEEESSGEAPLPTAPPPSEQRPMPPDHPPPEEVRPSPPPESAVAQQPPLPLGPMGGQRPPFQPQPPPPSLPPQHQPGLLPFPSNMAGPNAGQPQRFPWQMGNGPRPNMLNQGGPRGPPQNMLAQNNGPSFPPGHPQARGLLPVPEGRPLFPGDRGNLPFSNQVNQGQMMRDGPPQSMNSNMAPPVSAMAPLAQLTSLLPALERAKMAAAQQGGGGGGAGMMSQQPLPFKAPGQLPMPGLLGKGPLTSSSNNMPMPFMRGGRAGRNAGGDFSESTEVVDMDMSPGEDDCELELPSPNSDSGSDSRGRRRRRDHGPRSDKAGGALQPTAYVKALSKMIEKLTHKGQGQQASTSATSGGDRGKHGGHRKPRSKVDLNDDDVPASAVDLTNKEKFMKKLHLQERVIDEVKLAIKPFYASKKITKEQYKLILRKAVPKICHSKSGNINPQKIQQLVEAYVGKMRKGTGPPGAKKKKVHPGKDAASAGGNKEKEAGGAPAIRQNGERPKKGGR